MTDDGAISMAEFVAWEREARREAEAIVTAFEAAGDTENAKRARFTLAFIDRAVIVANGGRGDN